MKRKKPTMGKCAYCTHYVPVTHKGRLVQHANYPRKVCLGSGKLPARPVEIVILTAKGTRKVTAR